MEFAGQRVVNFLVFTEFSKGYCRYCFLILELFSGRCRRNCKLTSLNMMSQINVREKGEIRFRLKVKVSQL